MAKAVDGLYNRGGKEGRKGCFVSRMLSVLCLSYRYRGKIRLGGEVVDTRLRPTKEQEIAKILGGQDRFILIALHPPGIWREGDS